MDSLVEVVVVVVVVVVEVVVVEVIEAVYVTACIFFYTVPNLK